MFYRMAVPRNFPKFIGIQSVMEFFSIKLHFQAYNSTRATVIYYLNQRRSQEPYKYLRWRAL